jgi:hypothetical protein
VVIQTLQRLHARTHTHTHAPIQFALASLKTAVGGGRGLDSATTIRPAPVFSTLGQLCREDESTEPRQCPTTGIGWQFMLAGSISNRPRAADQREPDGPAHDYPPRTLVATEQNREISLTTERGNGERVGSRRSGEGRDQPLGHCTLGATQQINQYAGRRSAQRCGLLDDAPPPKPTDCPWPVHTHRLRRRHLSRSSRRRRLCCFGRSCSCNACIAAW